MSIMGTSLKPPDVILITGTSSGFGLLTAARLAAKGYKVFATMRDVNKKAELLKEVEWRGGRVQVLRLDVTDKISIKMAVKEIMAQNGRIDCLINNAGYGIGGFFEDLTEEEIRAQFDVNFFGIQNVCREVVPIMRQQRRGRIVNVSSIAGLQANPCFSAYNASKFAVEAFSESLYYEMKLFGVDVILVEPGTYPTKIFKSNARYAKNFSNPESPYYKFSQFLNQKVMDYVDHCRKKPEDVAQLIEKLIEAKNPSLHNFPDKEARIRYLFSRFLPFRLSSWIIRKALYSGMK